MQPVILNLAPTGMVPTKGQNPYLPISPDEVAKDVAECAALGVSMFHLHARDSDGSPSVDQGLFAELVFAAKEAASGGVIITTTSGRLEPDVNRRASSLFLDGGLQPDMASLTLGSLNFSSSASANDPKTIQRLAEIMLERGIRPELEVFDLGMVNYAKILIDKGLIKPPFYFNILLGNPGTAQASLLHLGAIVSDLPPGSIWSVGGLGRFQTVANALGVAVGHGVRIGLEDNLWMDDQREILASNRLMTERAVAMAQASGRGVASVPYVRAVLGLKEGSHAE